MRVNDNRAGEDEVLAWRDQVSLRFLRGISVALLVGAGVVAIAISHGRGSRAMVVLSLLSAVGIGIPAFTGRPRGRARAWIAVVPALLVATGGFAMVGILSGPGVAMMLTLMLAGLLLGRRAMVGLTVAASFAVGLIGWAMVHGVIPAPAAQDIAMTSAVTWARSGSITFITTGLFGALILAVVSRIETALRLARSETERRQQAERARAEAEIVAIESKKLETIGRLAAGVAHDFNNNLTIIMGSAELLKYMSREREEPRNLADSIVQASHRAAELTRQLLAYARRAQMVMSPTDLHVVIADAVSLLRRSVDPGVKLITKLDAAHPVVAADKALIESALLNLLVNARDAMPGGGTITIQTRSLVLDGGSTPTGPTILVEVADTGIGIPRDLLPQIFEPFFTTKPIGRGTGLGLAAVAGTIKAHGGRIEVESEDGRGTVFRIYLPSSQAETTDAPAPFADIVRGTGEILLVDDDAMVGVTAVSTLRSLGYDITRVTDGDAALAEVRDNPRRFALVLLDLRMPGMSGEATFDALRSIDPALKILIWSGYAAEQDIASMLRRGAVGFVRKPYRVAELSHTIAQALRSEIAGE